MSFKQSYKLLHLKNLFLHDHHIPGVGSAVEDGLLVETAYNKNNKIIIIQFEHLLLHDYHLPGVGSDVEDGLPVETTS